MRNVKKILIVDDMPEGREALKQALARPGITIFEAESGRLALEVHRRERADLIFLDFTMPGLDGEEVTRRIRADTTLREVSIVMVSDDARDVIRSRALAAGANGFLTRPFNVADLHKRVEQLAHVASRKPTQLLAQVEPAGGASHGAPFIGRILNLSTTGLLLETDGDVDLGKELVVTFSVPGSLSRVRAESRVMRRALDRGAAKWGLRFTSLDSAGRLALMEYVSRSAAQR